jgi:hypothetical protein
VRSAKESILLNTPPILVRPGFDENDWVNHFRYFEHQFPTVAGNIDKLKQLANQNSRRWITAWAVLYSGSPVNKTTETLARVGRVCLKYHQWKIIRRVFN